MRVRHPIFLLLFLGGCFYLVSKVPLEKKEITTADQVFQDAPCLENATLECIQDFLRHNFRMAGDKRSSWKLAQDLGRAGLYDKSIKVMSENPSSLNTVALKNIIAFQIALEANKYPEKVASFDVLQEALSTDTGVGKLLPEAMKGSFQAQVYSTLAFLLMGQIGEAGDFSYVQYHQQAAIDQFKPNATWRFALESWEEQIEKLEEPERSNNLIRIPERLIEIGEYQLAQDKLSSINAVSETYRFNLTKAWMNVGDYDQAIEVSREAKHRTPYYRALVAKANQLIQEDRIEEAVSLLQFAGDEIRNSQSKVGQLDSLIDVIAVFHDVGRDDEARQLADWIQQKFSEKVYGPLGYEKMSQAYRAAGDLDEARDLMRRIVKTTRSRCNSVSDEINRFYAVELYLLGMHQPFEKVISAICMPSEKYEAWLRVYAASLDAGQDVPTEREMLADISLELQNSFYNSLASIHFMRDEVEKGNDFLGKAYSSADSSGKAASLCHTAIIAHFSNRPDLLDGLLQKAVIVANSEKLKPKRYAGHNLLFSMMDGADLDKGFSAEYQRYLDYLSTAACHNMIRIDSLAKRPNANL